VFPVGILSATFCYVAANVSTQTRRRAAGHEKRGEILNIRAACKSKKNSSLKRINYLCATACA